MKVYITTTVGQSTVYVFDVESTTTIRQLKEYYHQKANTKVDFEKILLELDGRQFDDDNKTLFDYGIKPDAMLNLTYRDFQGRNPTFGAHFVDVSNKEGLKRIEWAKTAPDWLIAAPGLCLEGLCKNGACVAKDRKVIMSMGYIEFDVLRGPNSKTTKCPMCSKYVNPTTCGFNNCWWKYEGIKQPNEYEEPKTIASDWQHADNAYHRFDEEKSGIIQWRDLKLTAAKTKPNT
ncbi:unnamed protein product [Rotaria sp. Silwood1]|nr:unnamed protein product [Rotaria sp. Silwood1]CAF1375259.1 unnamed protein product [Rotaria sp. Silwood1]CAF3530503.1 unnamed protein product [Rotaria sp. Silwood1]CAF3603206.1 unnamed protein product [Rotaria sp. Silwood1]CAF4554431.1 unnamed protein product [Rotaria sp. Silwood1]